jgi:hypothetical protein
MKQVLVALALACLLVGCGSDGAFIIAFNSGIIAGDPSCRTDGGQFNMRDQGGLVLLVIITSNTKIVVGDIQGTCKDLNPNVAVKVGGPRDGDRIKAQSVQVL